MYQSVRECHTSTNNHSIAAWTFTEYTNDSISISHSQLCSAPSETVCIVTVCYPPSLRNTCVLPTNTCMSQLIADMQQRNCMTGAPQSDRSLWPTNLHRPCRGRLTVSAAIKEKSARQICCSKTLTSKPQSVDSVDKLCQQLVAFSNSRVSDRSSGVKEYNCVRDGWDSNVFHFWERYEGNEAMDNHNKLPQVAGFMESVSV